jgi:acetoin utilization protein AcuB
MRHIPPIKTVMTPFPYSIDIDAPIEEARAFMHKQNIRHLPVIARGKLAGIVSDRDIKLYLGPDLDYPQAKETRVRDVFLANPFVVDLNDALDNVLVAMAERHVGSVLVTRDGKLAGLFTATDACRSFADYLRRQYRPAGGDDAA